MEGKKHRQRSSHPATVSRPPDDDTSMDILTRAAKEILPGRENEGTTAAVSTSPRVVPASKGSSEVPTSPWVTPNIERGTGPPYPRPQATSQSTVGSPCPTVQAPTMPDYRQTTSQHIPPAFTPYGWGAPWYAPQGPTIPQAEGVRPSATQPIVPPYGMFPYGMPFPWPAALQQQCSSGQTVHRERGQDAADLHIGSPTFEAHSDDDEASLISANSAAQISSASTFRNPHRKDVGTPLSTKVIDWWKELRTNRLSMEDLKEELAPQAVPSDQANYFDPPELPAGIKKVFKQANSTLVARDDRLKSSHGHLLKAALPLLHLFDAIMDDECPDIVSKQLVVDHLTSSLILLGSASQSFASARQHLFDDIVDKRFEVLRKNSPSMSELFGSSIMKDIEETEKAHKLATKVTKAFSSTQREKRFTPYRLAMARSHARGHQGAASRNNFRTFNRRFPSSKSLGNTKPRSFRSFEPQASKN